MNRHPEAAHELDTAASSPVPAMGLRSIRHKLSIGVLLSTVTALLITGAVIIYYDLGDFRQRTLRDLSTQADLIGQASVAALQFDDPDTATGNLALLRLRPRVLGATLHDADGNVFARYGERLPETLPTTGFRIDRGHLTLSRPVQLDGEKLGSIQLLADYPFRERLLRDIGIVLAVAVMALGISMLISSWIQARITQPVLRVTELARRVVEKRDYSLRADGSSDDEIGYLIRAFNDMLAEIDRRTAELETSNRRLGQEIHERRQAADEVRRLNAELEQRVQQRTAELENANKELEAFSYSVSHDLRAPLRSIDGFSQALLEDYRDGLDATGQDYLERVRKAAQRMGVLIDDLLNLSRVSRAQLSREPLDLSLLAREILAQLQAQEPERKVEIDIEDALRCEGDPRLIRVVLDNLLGNAWKYSARRELARIAFYVRDGEEGPAFCIEDNGAGFDMAYADRLFGAFQRLHDARDFPGTGVGLATVQRIVRRHGGDVWAEAEVDKGARFYFTLPGQGPMSEEQLS